MEMELLTLMMQHFCKDTYWKLLINFQLKGMWLCNSHSHSSSPPTNTRILPSVNSIEQNGPFQVTIDKNVGPNNKGWILDHLILEV